MQLCRNAVMSICSYVNMQMRFYGVVDFLDNKFLFLSLLPKA